MQPLGKMVWKFLKNLRVAIWSSNLTAESIPDKSIIRKDTCTLIFIAALFPIVKIWKQPNFPSLDEWIMKMWLSLSLCICTHTYTYCGILLSHEKWNSAISAKWVDLEIIRLRKVSQKENDKYPKIHSYVESKI